MGKLLRPAFEKMISEVASRVKAPVVTEAPVAPAPPVDYRRVNLKNVYDSNSVLKKMFSNPEDYLSLFAKGGPVKYSYDNEEIMYAPKDQEIMDTTLLQDSKTEVETAPEKVDIYEFLNKGLQNISNNEKEEEKEEKGLASLFDKRPEYAGGGEVGLPPIAIPIINTEEQNLNVGINPEQNPFVSYARQFNIPDGNIGFGAYKQEGMPPTFGGGFIKKTGEGELLGSMNYNRDQGVMGNIDYSRQLPNGQFSGGINYQQGMEPRLNFEYRQQFKNGGLATMFRLK